MIELEYAKAIIDDRWMSTDKVMAICKALIAVTAQLEEVTKQLFAEQKKTAALRRIALGYHILTVPEREAPTEPEIDAAIAEIKAQGVGEFAADMWKRGNELVAEGGQQRLVVQVRLAAKLADTYVDNLRAGRKG